MPESQFQVFIDEVRLPADALVGAEDAAIAQLFAGLNPERIMGAASAVGMGRLALNKAADYVKTRQVWKTPIGAHQGIAHPLAQNHIELELARLMMQKAATLYDAGDDMGAAEAANMAKYAAGEASTRAVDQAVQSMGGNGLSQEYGVAAMLVALPAVPHRPGQPGDDPQLHRPDLTGPAAVVLRCPNGRHPRPLRRPDGARRPADAGFTAQPQRAVVGPGGAAARRAAPGRRGPRGAGGGAGPHRRDVLCGCRPVRSHRRRPAGGRGGRARELAALLRVDRGVPGSGDRRRRRPCPGGRHGLVGACDIVIAGPRSTFALTEARIGVAPAIISLTLLPKTDPAAAARYYLTGETFDARRAAEIGLVTEAADDVGFAVDAVTADLAKASPQGLAAPRR